MKRTLWMYIGDNNLPMRCTLGAIEHIYEKYGGNESFVKALGDAGKSMTVVLDALEIFIVQGCAYENMFNKHVADYPEGGYVPVPREVLECAFSMDDYPMLAEKVISCLNLSMDNTIKAKESKKQKK